MKMNQSTNADRGLTEINLTSLVDVCLTLVIIFMVSYPMIMQSSIKVSTPSLKKAKQAIQETELKAEINLKADDVIELNGVPIAQEIFADSLRSLMNASEDKLVIVSADGAVMHDKVVAILDEAKQCGAKKLSIVRRN